jgi:protein-tyrosine phosphatase
MQEIRKLNSFDIEKFYSDIDLINGKKLDNERIKQSKEDAKAQHSLLKSLYSSPTGNYYKNNLTHVAKLYQPVKHGYIQRNVIHPEKKDEKYEERDIRHITLNTNFILPPTLDTIFETERQSWPSESFKAPDHSELNSIGSLSPCLRPFDCSQLKKNNIHSINIVIRNPIKLKDIGEQLQITSCKRPWETKEDALNTLKFAKEKGIKTLFSLDNKYYSSSFGKSLTKHLEEYDISHNMNHIDDGIDSNNFNKEEFYKIMEKFYESYKSGPVLIHCGAGNGRSGVFKAVIYMHLNKTKYELVRSFLRDKEDLLKPLTNNDFEPDENLEPVKVYSIVKESCEKIRDTHPDAIERAEDIEILNKMLHFLANRRDLPNNYISNSMITQN